MKANLPHAIGMALAVFPSKILSHVGYRVFPRKVENLPVAGCCEIGFVLGGGKNHTRAQRALELWHNHKIHTILVTGGHGPFTPPSGQTEADTAHDFLRANGVPEENILVENRSRNTLENVRFGLDLLHRHGFPDATTSFVVITHDFHVPRAVGLLWTALSNDHPIVYWSGIKDEFLSRETWRESPEARFWIIKEDLRLAHCKLTGKIRYGIIKPQFR